MEKKNVETLINWSADFLQDFLSKEKQLFAYAQILLRGARSDVFISSILAATMKSFMLKPPAIVLNILVRDMSDNRSWNKAIYYGLG